MNRNQAPPQRSRGAQRHLFEDFFKGVMVFSRFLFYIFGVRFRGLRSGGAQASQCEGVCPMLVFSRKGPAALNAPK